MGRVWAMYLLWYQSARVSAFNEIPYDLGQTSIAKSSMDLSYWRQICLGVCWGDECRATFFLGQMGEIVSCLVSQIHTML